MAQYDNNVAKMTLTTLVCFTMNLLKTAPKTVQHTVQKKEAKESNIQNRIKMKGDLYCGRINDEKAVIPYKTVLGFTNCKMTPCKNKLLLFF